MSRLIQQIVIAVYIIFDYNELVHLIAYIECVKTKQVRKDNKLLC